MTTAKRTNYQIIFLLITLVQSNKLENGCRLTQESKIDTLTEIECTHLPKVNLPGEFKSLTVKGNLGPIYKELLEPSSMIQKLNLSNCNITEVTDGTFSDLKNLSTLILSNNHVEFVTEDMFSDLTSLTELHLDGNNINGTTANSFIGTPFIQILNLQNNQLHEIPTGLPTTLVALNLTGNNIEYVELEPLDHLENLSLCYNPIISWPEDFLVLPELKYLCLGYSATSIRFSGNVSPNLKHLCLSAKSEDRIYLQSINILELGSLEKLVIENYTMDNLDFLDIENLKILHLLNIKYLAKGNTIFPSNLTELHLDSSHNIANFLINYGKIPDLLRALSLKNNNITILDKNQARTLMNISSLDISQNPIECQLSEWSWILDRIKLQPSFLKNSDWVVCDEPEEEKGKKLLLLLLQSEREKIKSHEKKNATMTIENSDDQSEKSKVTETIYTTLTVISIIGILFLLLYIYYLVYQVIRGMNKQQDVNMETICSNENRNVSGRTTSSGTVD